MSLLCGSGMEVDKENVRPTVTRAKTVTPHCFGVKTLNDQRPPPTDMDSHTICIRRGRTGFGFSVTGACPVRVKRVEEGSTSYSSGLRKDDRIIRINGQSVGRSIADSVAKIVRQSEKQIVLDIERESIEDKSRSPDGHGLGEIPRRPLSTIRESANENSAAEVTQVVCRAEIEPPPRTTSLDSLPSPHTDTESLIDLGDWPSPQSHRTSFPPITISFNELSGAEQDRQSLIQELVHCEQDFLAQMQFGIQRYSEPLRHKLISPAEHATLFQNVEKLVSISEYHVYKLQEEAVGYSDGEKSDKFIDNIGSIYLTKVLVMVEVFEHYCNNIKNAFRLLAELKEFKEFTDFVHESSLESNQPTLSGFIQKPLEHIKHLVLSLQSVLSLTPLEHQDTDSLSQVVDTIRNTCNRINDSNTRRSRSMTSLVSHSRSKKRSRSSSSNSSMAPSVLSSDSSNSSIESSLDPAVLDVQRRLVFCEHVQTFQLATATRHMIYGGELMYVDGLLCTRLYVVLMSDLILLAKVEPDERLLVVDHPLLLQDLVSTDFRDDQTLDFCLTVESVLNEEWVEERDITLRAPSMEQKYTWKNILEQRTRSARAHGDFSNMDNFV